MLWRIIVQEFRRAFILPHLHISIIRHRGNNPVIPNLVGVIGFRAPFLVHISHGLGVGRLVAGIPVCGQPKLIRDPLAEMT